MKISYQPLNDTSPLPSPTYEPPKYEENSEFENIEIINCPHCTYLNPSYVLICELCESLISIKCNTCTFLNKYDKLKCDLCDNFLV